MSNENQLQFTQHIVCVCVCVRARACVYTPGTYFLNNCHSIISCCLTYCINVAHSIDRPHTQQTWGRK